MSDHQAHYPVRVTARLLGVSSSGYYAWNGRQPSEHARADGVLLQRIRGIH